MLALVLAALVSIVGVRDALLLGMSRYLDRCMRCLYQDSLKPIAELDPSGAVLSRFVYATKSNGPIS